MGPVSSVDLKIDVRTYVTIVDPVTGNTLRWSEIMDRVEDAEVVLLGELHDHAVGHAVQLAVVDEVLERWPLSTVAFEMLERDEQILIDDYMDGNIDAKTFASLTGSSSWAGKGSWSAWYQPILDSIRQAGGNALAANAPRRYVKLAKTGGFERIDELPSERRVLVDYPEELSAGRYRQRFWELGMHGEITDGVVDMTTIDPDDPMLPVFRSQQVWDATMAESIARQQPTMDKKVLLLVGQFHIEYNGGVVQELKRRLPNANVLSISIQREIPAEEAWDGVPVIADLMVVGEDPKR